MTKFVPLIVIKKKNIEIFERSMKPIHGSETVISQLALSKVMQEYIHGA